MTTRLSRTGKGRYRHDRLGVEIEKTAMPDHPWELSGADPHGSGMVLARTLSDARAFLQEVEAHVHHEPDARSIGDAEAALLALHHYLYPERYENVPTHVWDAGTIMEVADMLERALASHPDAHLAPR